MSKTNFSEKVLDFQVSSRFSLKDKIFFFRELAYLLEWGIGIPVAMDTIYQNTENTKLQYICSEVNTLIRQWEPISKALTRLDEFFNEWDIHIIRSWESTWKLATVLNHLAEQYEKLYEIKMKYIWALLYPSILILVIIGAMYMIFAFILPGFVGIIESFPASSIPWSTKLLMSFQKFINGNMASIAFWGVISVFLFLLFLSTEEGKIWYDNKILKVPLIGKIVRLYSIVKFLRYFNLLMESGLNIIAVFTHIKGIMNNSLYRNMCDDIILALNKWESMIPPMRDYEEIIPSDVVVLLKVWEDTANLSKAARNSIKLYEQEFNKIIDNLSKIIEPILIIFIWGVIWIVALSIFSVIVSVIGWVENM